MEDTRIMNSLPRLLYTRREAAEALHLSDSSVDMLITQRILRPVRKGRRVLIARAEIERVAGLKVQRIWPAKVDGKTTRHFAPALGKPPRAAQAETRRKKTA